MKNICLSLFVVIIALMPCASAEAESETVTDRFTIASDIKGCDKEMKQHCSSVTPGENREILCLSAYEDKLSDACRTGLMEAAMEIRLGVAVLDYAYESCGGDRVKLCGDVMAGEGRLINCMRNHELALSDACIKSLKETGLWDLEVEPAAKN